MIRTYLVVLNILITSLHSIARPIDIVTLTSFEDGNYNIDDQTLRIPDETDDDFPVLVRKDDLISTSNLNKIYTIEHKFATTRSLKDVTENEGFKNADLKQVSRTTKLKSSKKIEDEPEEKSDTTEAEKSDTTEAEEIETRTDKRVESKSSEKSSATGSSGEEKSKTVEQEKRSGTTAKSEEKSKTATEEEITTLERNDTAAEVGESKDTKKEESKTEEFTSELNGLEKTTTSFRRAVKDRDYLENDDFEINDKVTPYEDSQRKGYEMLVNDESNSSWDLLDDLPTSRRMISQPDHLNIEVKPKAGNEIVQPVEIRNVLETKITSRNHISHDNMFGPPATPIIPIPQFRSTVLVPHIHPALLPQRRFIIPGFIKVPPVVTINFRRQLNQEGNNVLNRNIQHEHVEKYNSNNVMNHNRNIVLNPNERSEVRPKFKDVVEDYKSEDLSNAYSYRPVDLYSPETPQAPSVNPLFTKLIEASEHPLRSNPNVNREYVQNFPNIPYSNIMSPDKNNYYASNGGNMQNYPGVSYARPYNYAVPQNYGGFQYLTGFGRPRLY